MASSIIEVEALSKQYRIRPREPYMVLREVLSNAVRTLFHRVRNNKKKSQDIFLALDTISFHVDPGETVGIIGRNGAGKTTLLKILSRITYPTKGIARLKGRVGSLLEVGTGFHPELTGRENIYFNGSILGMTKREVDQKFNEIVEFSEVEQFLDTPVKRYSSGMQLRLAFSVAAHLEPEILLVDEVLAVGDVQFQKKCLGKMSEVARSGRTVLFVSHNMEAVERLCSRTILLHEGKVIADGSTREVMKQYLQVGMEEQGERVWKTAAEAPGDEVVRMHSVRIKNKEGRVSTDYDVRDPVTIELEYWVLQDGYALDAACVLKDERGYPILFSYDNRGSPWSGQKRAEGFYRSICAVPGDFLNDGQVTVDVGICTHPHPVHVSITDVVRFQVKDTMDPEGVRGNYPRAWPGGAVRPRLEWRVEKK